MQFAANWACCNSVSVLCSIPHTAAERFPLMCRNCTGQRWDLLVLLVKHSRGIPKTSWTLETPPQGDAAVGVGEELTPHLARASICCPYGACVAALAQLSWCTKVLSALPGCSQSSHSNLSNDSSCPLHEASPGGSTSTEHWGMPHGFLPWAFSFCLVLRLQWMLPQQQSPQCLSRVRSVAATNDIRQHDYFSPASPQQGSQQTADLIKLAGVGWLKWNISAEKNRKIEAHSRAFSSHS